MYSRKIKSKKILFIAGLGSTGSSAVCDIFSSYENIIAPSEEWRIWVDPDGLIDLSQKISLESSLFWQTTAFERFRVLVNRLIKPGFGPYSRLSLPSYIIDSYKQIFEKIKLTLEIEKYPGIWYGNSNDFFAKSNFIFKKIFWKNPLINNKMIFSNTLEQKEVSSLIGEIVEIVLEKSLKSLNADLFAINENYSILFSDSIFEMHPNSKIIVVVRNPFDVYADSKRVGWLAMPYDIKQFIKWQNILVEQVESARLKWPDKILITKFENLCTNYDLEFDRINKFIPGFMNEIKIKKFFPERSKKNINQWKINFKWLDEYRDSFNYFSKFN